MKLNICLLSALAAVFLLCGCGDSAPVELDELSVFQGGEQCALPGEEFSKPLYILASGKVPEGILSSGERPPSSG